MCGVPHHLLNILESNEKANVRFFREMAMNVVEEVNQRSALPIVVGGTHYYIEGLLFQNYERESLQPQGTGEYQESLQEVSSYAQLQQLDPIVAATIHPKDTRRIEKALANHLVSIDDFILPS